MLNCVLICCVNGAAGGVLYGVCYGAAGGVLICRVHGAAGGVLICCVHGAAGGVLIYCVYGAAGGVLYGAARDLLIWWCPMWYCTPFREQLPEDGKNMWPKRVAGYVALLEWI